MSRLMPRSLRARLTALAALIAALAFSTTSLLLLSQVPGNLRETVRTQAELMARRVAGQARMGQLPRTVRPGVVGPKGAYLVQVIGPDERIVSASEGIAGRPRIAAFEPEGYERIRTRDIKVSISGHQTGDDYLAVALRVQTPRGPMLVYTAVDLSEVNRAVTLVRLIIYLGTPFVVGVIALAAWFTVGLTLRPVRRIRQELEEISGQNLSRRVPVPDSDDEIAKLAVTTNATLERLERSAEAQRRFVADASHELRSPISGLQTQLEVDGMYPEETDWRESNRRALRAIGRLAAIVEELLMLAKLDAGTTPDRRVVNMRALAAEQVERRTNARVPVHGDPAADARATEARAAEAPVLGSPIQLDRVLTNLLDNAVRHARERVDLRVEADGTEVTVTVTDDGGGVPASDRERVFERFTRLADGRRLDKGGSGLGLPLAREIAMKHGGSLQIVDHSPGACFVLRLPQAS